MAAPPETRARKTAAWWDGFWRRPQAARGRALTCRRTAEEALRLLGPELARRPVGSWLRVLDLGCGNGDLTPLLLQDRRIRIVALDLSAEALAQFRRRLGGRCDRPRLLRASAYRLPFRDGAFDAVVSFGYASAASYAGVQFEVARVLRPGGVAVVDFANPSLYHWLAGPRATLRWYRRFRDPAEAQYHFGRRGLAAHFRPAGLALEAVRYLNAYPPLDALARRPWSAAADRALAGTFGPLLGRVLLAQFRRS
jgi:SAM-dependent methyltransferase